MAFVRRVKGLKKVAPTFYCNMSARLSKDLVAGDYSLVSYGVDICPRVTIGRYVMLGPYVAITGDDHNYNQPAVPMYFSGRPVLRHTIIEDDVWIGYRAIIMAGTTIGKGSIIAAGSIVTRDVAPFSIVAGVPAKFLRKRFDGDDMLKHIDFLQGPTVKNWSYPDSR